LQLRAVIETAPYDSVMSIAQSLDDERAAGNVRSELHGIPMLFKVGRRDVRSDDDASS
jgi:amidase